MHFASVKKGIKNLVTCICQTKPIRYIYKIYDYIIMYKNVHAY